MITEFILIKNDLIQYGGATFNLNNSSDKIELIKLMNEKLKSNETLTKINTRLDETNKELEERNNRQGETLQKQQEMIDNYIDIKAKLNAKITEYETKAEEYELSACSCGSKHNWIKKTALEEFKEEVFQ